MTHKQDQKPLYNMVGMRKKALDFMLDGIHLSELKGLSLGLGTSLRTRISELRAMGYDIKGKNIPHNGTAYKEYYLLDEEIERIRNDKRTS